MRIDANGTRLWERRLETSSYDYGYGIAAIGSGIFVSGFTGGAFSGFANAGGLDGWAARYELDGTLRWVPADPAHSELPLRAPPGPVAVPASVTDNETTNLAFFGDGESALPERFDLLFGLRYDNEEVDNIASATTGMVEPLPPGFEFLAPLLGTETSTIAADYEAWLPKFGLRWNASPDASFSFVAQRAYRAGGAEISVLDGAVTTFDPEFLWNYELASCVVGMGGRLRWNANLYYSDWSNQQVAEPIPGLPTLVRTVNSGESTLYGFETDVSFDATDNLEVYGGLGYAFTEVDDFRKGNLDPTQPGSEANQENFAGNRFPFAARWSANFGFAYRSDDGVFGGIDGNYQSSVFSGRENFAINECCDRVLVNARIGYTWQNLSLRAYVRNAFDEQYYSFVNFTVPGDEIARLGNPRTFAVRLDADF